jgi:prepilin-type processing-associated H-X9-DG protein
MPKQWRAFPSTGPSDGVLGEFYPTQDVILDSAYPMVNGRRVYLTKTIESGQRSAIFNFTRVYIPAGIRVQVKDYDYVVFNARGDIIVEGTVDARGSNVMFKSGGNILFADGSTVMADGANGIRGEVG